MYSFILQLLVIINIVIISIVISIVIISIVLPTLDVQFITSSGKHFIHFGLCTLYARLVHYLFQSVICLCTNEKSTGGKMHPAFVLGLLRGCGGQLLAFFPCF